MRIVLINPSVKKGLQYGLDDGMPKGLMDFLGGYQPLGILYIASVLKQNGYRDIHIIDAEAEDLNISEVVKKVEHISPDIIGISCMTFCYLYVLDLAKLLKNTTESPIVIGGYHVDFYAEEILAHSCFDIAVKGEGEYTFLEIVSLLETEGKKNFKHKLKDILGISYHKNGQIISTPKRDAIKNLDNIPFPARELVPIENYYQNYLPNPFISLLTTRGCPYNCSYCCHPNWYKQARLCSSEYVVDEIEYCVKKFNTTSFQFFDDNFTLKKSRILEICNLLRKRKLNINFLMISRVDLFLDEEMVRALKQAGCRCVSFGIESGDQSMLDKINKGTTVEQAKESFELCKKYDIDIVAYFIVGFPEETYSSLNNTIKFIRHTNPDWFKANILIPYPGSSLYETLLREGKIVDFWKDMTLSGKPPDIPNICKNFTRKELEKFRNKINLMPYLRKKSNLFNFRKIKNLSNVIWSLRWASRALLNRLSL